MLEASSLTSRTIAIEGQAEIGGIAEAVAVLQRAGDLQLDVLGLERARQPRHRNLLEVPGVDADHLMRAQRGRAPARIGSEPVVPRSGAR